MPRYIFEGFVGSGIHLQTPRVVPDVAVITCNSWLSPSAGLFADAARKFDGFGLGSRAGVCFGVAREQNEKGQPVLVLRSKRGEFCRK